MSKTFTAYDEWRTPTGGTCAACGWGYTTTQLRQSAHLVTRAPTLTALSRAEVCDLLSTPVRVDHAVVVPLRPGRKHLFPVAQWGTVTVDDTSLGWTVEDGHRLRLVQQLRGWGFTGPSMGDSTPPFSGLRRHPTQRWSDVLQAWSALEPWRQARRYLDLAVVVTAAPRILRSDQMEQTA